MNEFPPSVWLERSAEDGPIEPEYLTSTLDVSPWERRNLLQRYDIRVDDYVSGQRISRAEAWRDLKADFVRIQHAYTDIFVNIMRLIGVDERDQSQLIGRVWAIGVPIVLGFTGWSWWQS